MNEPLSKSQRLDVLERQVRDIAAAISTLQKLQPELVSIARYLNERISTVEKIAADLHVTDPDPEGEPAKRKPGRPKAESKSQAARHGEQYQPDEGEPEHV